MQNYNKRKMRVWQRNHLRLIYFIAGLLVGFILGLIIIAGKKALEPIKSPIPTEKAVKIEATPSPKPPQRPTYGKASYYSEDGCIGCDPDRIMANGERLDDDRPTVAYNHLPLNTRVTITNLGNGKTVTVPVTDRGGFEAHGKIADLSLATKNALQCGDVCLITIDF